MTHRKHAAALLTAVLLLALTACGRQTAAASDPAQAPAAPAVETPDHYEDLGNGIYQVYVKIDGKVVPYVTVDSATGDYHG